MFSKLLKKGKLQKGFTIIEVMIVLAIAGLILVVVLIAIPQLQRNQRNEQRKSVAARIVTEINNYSGNNNGTVPVALTTSVTTSFGNPEATAGFLNRYLGCPGGVEVECSININDPRTGLPVGSGSLGSDLITTTAPLALVDLGGTTNLGTNPGSIGYFVGALCNGEVVTTAGASGRNFLFQMRLEGGAVYCLDNN
jgi:prepilin-type N-terminal cleavage/methylation domain-containing protein